jgi:hypothetical protein
VWCAALRGHRGAEPSLYLPLHRLPTPDRQRVLDGAVIPAEAITFTGAEPRPFQRVADSGRTMTRWVCPECGTWISSGRKPGSAAPDGFLTVRAGTLDDTSWLRPAVHFWTRSGQPWVVVPEDSRRFETQPEDLSWDPAAIRAMIESGDVRRGD